MNFEEEKYPTLPSYDDHSRDSHENIHEERQRLISAVSELDKLKSEMEARIRKEYEDKLRKEDEERKEKEAYTEFQKDFDTLIESLNIDQRSKNIIEHINKVLKEVVVFILYYNKQAGSFICITNNNVYHVHIHENQRSTISPLYKFNKKLLLNECKFLFNLLRKFLYPPNVVPLDHKETFRYIIDGYISYYDYKDGHNVIKRSKQIENIIKLFPGKYDYDGYERVDNDIFQNTSLLINKKEMKLCPSSYINYITLQL